MSDNLKRYCAIQSHLKQLFPAEPTANQARHLNTLAALVSGIIGSKSCQLPAIARKLPQGCSPQGAKKHESRNKRLVRFLQNSKVTQEAFFLPYAQALIQSLPPGPLVLIMKNECMDGSQIGRGCMALMLCVLFQQGDKYNNKQRALPLCWLVVAAKKGHFTQERHQSLLAQVKKIIPAHRQVVFLGDGEFDGPNLLNDIDQAGWHYVCRTAKNVLLAEADWSDETFSLSEMIADGSLAPGDCVELPDLLFTAQELGPVLVGAVWELGHKEPLLLVTNLDFFSEARQWYMNRGTRNALASKPSSRIRRAEGSIIFPSMSQPFE